MSMEVCAGCARVSSEGDVMPGGNAETGLQPPEAPMARSFQCGALLMAFRYAAPIRNGGTEVARSERGQHPFMRHDAVENRVAPDFFHRRPQESGSDRLQGK